MQKSSIERRGSARWRPRSVRDLEFAETEKGARGGDAYLPTRRQRHWFVINPSMNALLFERPVWFATGPLVLEEEPQEMEDFTYHRPVLAADAVELLMPHPGSLVVDGTLGSGGHAEAILKTGADVLALDQDPDAIAEAREQLARYGRRITLHQSNFRDVDKVLDELGVQRIGGALLDLGVSSRQLENAWRGFSMVRNGPLDMRMDPRSAITAAHIVNNYSEEDLTRIFRDLGEEPAARRLGSLIVKMRKDAPFTETLQLARAIEKVVGRHGRRHPATQAFQALRMEVNDELGALEQGLRVFTARLEIGARIVVIAFHSLEDRIVKNFIRDHSREWLDRPEWPQPQRNPVFDLRAITGKPIEPSENERRTNPRSRSAKLRVAEKIR